jgi:RNA polymerase sigma-70 factor (ECF subfamily)
MKPLQHSDDELVRGLRRGDKGAFEQLFLRYIRQAHYFVKGKVYSDDVAKEIVQEVFADIWHRRRDREIRNFAAYLFSALRYSTIKYIKGLIDQRKCWDHYSQFIPTHADQTQLDINFDLLADALEKGLAQLPEKTQTVFRLNRLEGKSLAEISRSLNLTEKAIQYHLTKSIKELRIHLKDYMVSAALVLLHAHLLAS